MTIRNTENLPTGLYCIEKVKRSPAAISRDNVAIEHKPESVVRVFSHT
jgi:hypothetical protein